MLRRIKQSSQIHRPILLISFITTILISLSFYIRVNIISLFSAVGFNIGEIWVFFTRYSKQSIYDFFYPIEYPVGFVLVHKIVLLINQLLFPALTYPSFVLSHAVIMVPLSIAFVYSVYRLSILVKSNARKALLYLFLSLTFFIASTTNYDLFPALFTLLATWLIIKNKLYLSFICLAFGTIMKLYPAFLIPLFIFFAYSKKFTAFQIANACLIYMAVLILVNLPFIQYNFEYWLIPYIFQPQNPQRLDPNTISYYFANQFRMIFLLTFISISWAITFLFYYNKILTNKNFILLLYFSAFTIVFANQVNVPQYLLWFLPFAAIVQSPGLILWLIIDLINSLILFFGTKINYLPQIRLLIFHLMVINFSLLYLFLVYKIIKSLRQTRNRAT